jgi:hypothetical protein
MSAGKRRAMRALVRLAVGIALLAAAQPRLYAGANASPLTATEVCGPVELRAALEEVTAHEVAARRAEDWGALQTLLHPQAAAAWRERQQYTLDPGLGAVDLVRIEQRGEWALAAAIETAAGSQVYTTRTFRQNAQGCWQLTSPRAEAWGASRLRLEGEGFSLFYHPFDEPYVRAVAPRLRQVLPQMVANFGIVLPRGFQFAIEVTPFQSYTKAEITPDMATVYVPSPLVPGFSLSQAQSPEEFLLGYTTDLLGPALLDIAYGAAAAEAPRLALGHPAIQWEAERAVDRSPTAQAAATARLVAQLGAAEDRRATPLKDLLDPTAADAAGGRQAELDLFFRWAVSAYGEKIAAPYLKAVFSTGSAPDLVQAAFGEDLASVEAAWRAWLQLQRAAAAPAAVVAADHPQ